MVNGLLSKKARKNDLLVSQTKTGGGIRAVRTTPMEYAVGVKSAIGYKDTGIQVLKTRFHVEAASL